MPESSDMKANTAAATASPPPNSFTHSTAYTIPRSSPWLSSTFRPFYPRAHQQVYPLQSSFMGSYDGDCQGSLQLLDDVTASRNLLSSWTHMNNDKYYDQQYCLSFGVDPYEVSWMPNDGFTWDNSAWQQNWSDFPIEYTYPEEEAVDSAISASDSPSFYARSHNLMQGTSAFTSINTISAPSPSKNTQLLSCQANEVHQADVNSSIAEGAAMLKVFGSVFLPEQLNISHNKVKESSLSNSAELESKEEEASGYRHNLVSDEREEIASPTTDNKLDLNLSASQFAIQMTSGSGTHACELKSTTDFIEHSQAHNVLKKASPNLKSEHGSVDAINTKYHAPLTSDSSEGSHSSNIKPSTISPIMGECKKAQSNTSEAHRTDLQSSDDLYETVASPKPVISQACRQVNDSEVLHLGHKNPSLIQRDNFGLCSNEFRVVIECIHSLSKVLLSSQSKGSMISLDSSDCSLLENTICMLSHRLLQCSGMDSDSYHDPNSQLNDAEREPNKSSDSMNAFVESDCLQKTSSSQISNLKQIINFISNFQHEVLQNVFGLPCGSVGVNQTLNLANVLEGLHKEQIELIGEIQKLQEVGYERSETNVTESIYKDLWSKTQDALKVSKAELQEIRGELAVVKRELTNLKLSGGTITGSVMVNDSNGRTLKQEANESSVETSCHGVVRSDLSEAPINDNIQNSGCGRLQEGLEFWAEYFDAGSIATHSTGRTPSVKVGIDLKQSELAATLDGITKASNQRSSEQTLPLSASLENNVAQRLSLLLSRKGLDLNKSFIEGRVEDASGAQVVLEPSSKGPGNGEMIPSNEKYLSWSETSCLVNGNNGPEFCYQMPVFVAAASEHDLLESNCDDAGSDYSELVGICEEDDIEIICFKPGATDSNVTCLTPGPEWEDVFVSAVDDQRLTEEIG